MYQNLLSDPSAVFQDSLLSTVYQNHPWAPKLPRPDDFSKIDIDRALQIYKERYGSASGFTFIIVGSFEVSEIKPLIAAYIASLPAGSQKTEVRDVGLRPVKGVVKKEFFKGKEEKSVINISFYGESPYTEAENLKLDMLLEVLNITVIETLREDMSGVYGAGVYGGLRKYPYNHYSITVGMPCGPENVGKLVEASFNEINKVMKDGPKEDDLNKVKETLKKKYEEDIKENTYWATALQSAIEYGSDARSILSFKERLDKITVKDIKDTANKYFDMKNYVQAVLYPEK
jgi:zinc protease